MKRANVVLSQYLSGVVASRDTFPKKDFYILFCLHLIVARNINKKGTTWHEK